MRRRKTVFGGAPVKKRIILLPAVLCAIACFPQRNAAVEAKPQPPAVLIGDYTCCRTGIEVKELPERGVSGRTGSFVPATAVPMHPNETNAGSPDAPYICLDDGVALLSEGQGIFFTPE